MVDLECSIAVFSKLALAY